LLCGGRHSLRTLFAAQQQVGVAGQFFKANIRDRKAEVARSHILQLVCFVKYDCGSLRQNTRIRRTRRLLLHSQVGEEKVMVDDDDVRFERLAPHLSDETAAIVGAVCTEACVERASSLCHSALDSGNPDISERSPVSVVCSHAAICWY